MASTCRLAIGSHELGPDRQGGLHPLRAAPGLGRPDPAGELGRVLQPQVGQPERLGDLAALLVEHARITLGGHRLPGHVLGQVPVDRAALPGHQVGELAQRVGELLRIAQRAQRAAAPWPPEPAGTRAAGARPIRALVGVAGHPKAEGRVSHLRGLSGRMEESMLAKLSRER